MEPLTQFVILFITLLLVIFNVFDKRSTTVNNNLAESSDGQLYQSDVGYELKEDYIFINKEEVENE